MTEEQKKMLVEALKLEIKWGGIFLEIKKQQAFLKSKNVVLKKILLGRNEFLAAVKELYVNNKTFLMPERIDDMEIVIVPIESCLYVCPANEDTLNLIL